VEAKRTYPAAAIAADQAKRTYNVPAGEATVALRQFSETSGKEVLFAAETLRDVRTPALLGDFTPQEAVGALLKGTGLVAIQDVKTGAFAVRREESPNAPRAAQESASPKSTANASSSSPTKQSAEESIIELSPFVTSEKSVTGYAATETLSGTRMRTDLKDVSASLSILTPEFLQEMLPVVLERASARLGDKLTHGTVSM
jgi:hypothetical protein